MGRSHTSLIDGGGGESHVEGNHSVGARRSEVELLPAREALGAFNFAAILASNSSTALNVLTVGSVAASSANQVIIVNQ